MTIGPQLHRERGNLSSPFFILVIWCVGTLQAQCSKRVPPGQNVISGRRKFQITAAGSLSTTLHVRSEDRCVLPSRQLPLPRGHTWITVLSYVRKPARSTQWR